MKRFCERHVEPINKEADHLIIAALASLVAVDLQVAYLDLSGSKDPSGLIKVDFHNFGTTTTGSPSDPVPRLSLLYRPGHYDILHPREKLIIT
jgi:ubiquitin thioesterase protein OTUB1